jgi:hypothetical protein
MAKTQQPLEIVVVASKVKDVIKDMNSTEGSPMRCDGDLVTAVSDKVHKMLQAAGERARSNGRSTVRPHDL